MYSQIQDRNPNQGPQNLQIGTEPPKQVSKY